MTTCSAQIMGDIPSLSFSIYHQSAALGLYFSKVPRTWPIPSCFLFPSHHVITRILTSFLVGPLLPPWAPKAYSQHSGQMSLLKQKQSYPSAQMLQQPLSHLCERQKPYNDPHNLQSLARNLSSLQPILSNQVLPNIPAAWALGPALPVYGRASSHFRCLQNSLPHHLQAFIWMPLAVSLPKTPY